MPARLGLLVTGHQIEKQFSEYLGTNEEELLATHRQTAQCQPRLSA